MSQIDKLYNTLQRYTFKGGHAPNLSSVERFKIK
jgi:hypothetical protein